MLRFIALLLISLYSSQSNAGQFCFSYAENYYEQIYCEIKASGKGGGLPVWYDFRKSDEIVQALLLKPYVRSAGIKMTMPASTLAPVPSSKKITDSSSSRIVDLSLSNCVLGGDFINCSGKSYQLLSNKPNHQISKDALTKENRMGLADYWGSFSDAEAVDQYLSQSYYHYVVKMSDIGLGGSVLSYGKFMFLFDDLHRKGVGFSNRFEIMYHYLKLDKKKINVSIRSQLPEDLTLAQCFRLNSLLLCELGKRNMIFTNDLAL